MVMTEKHIMIYLFSCRMTIMATDESRSVPRTPLRRPSAYFERRDRPSLGIAAGIMVGEAIAIGVVLWLFIKQLLSNVDTSGVDTGDVQSALMGEIFVFVVLTFAGWLILGVVLHTFMWFASANRGFWSTLAVIGETEWVAFVFIPVTGVVLMHVASQAPSDPQAALDYVQRATANSLPLLTLIGFVGTIWRAVVSGIGLSTVHDVPRGKAYAASFIVGIVGFLLGLGAG